MPPQWIMPPWQPPSDHPSTAASAYSHRPSTGAAASASAAVAMAVAPTTIGPGHYLAPTGTPPATATSPYRSSVSARRMMAQGSLPQPPLGTAYTTYTTYTPASTYYASPASAAAAAAAAPPTPQNYDPSNELRWAGMPTNAIWGGGLSGWGRGGGGGGGGPSTEPPASPIQPQRSAPTSASASAGGVTQAQFQHGRATNAAANGGSPRGERSPRGAGAKRDEARFVVRKNAPPSPPPQKQMPPVAQARPTTATCVAGPGGWVKVPAVKSHVGAVAAATFAFQR